jgi:tRNA threonylcarbamoyladenosine biosynthesis protein TsaE
VIERVTNSPEETDALAATVAKLARPGDLIVLVGGLGAGKTRFVRGFVAAMGAAEMATSPTFALVHNYAAPTPIVHADLYRLVSEHEVLDLGLDEALADGAIVLVEWGDLAKGLLRAEQLTVTIRDLDETSRAFVFEGWDDRWAT